MVSTAFPVPQDAVEAGLLASVNQNMEHWLQVSSFTVDDFMSNREVFRFCGNYLAEYGSLPSNSQISTRFGWSPPIGDFEYWYKEMQRYALARRVMEVMQEAANQISQPELAMNTLLEKLSLVRSQQSNHIEAYDSSGLERLEKFDYRTETIFKANSMIGIPTGLRVLDDTHIGYIPGSLVGCYARPGVGKTWWLLWSGMIAWLAGYKVLAITPEMPSNLLDLRVDVLAGAQLGYPIHYGKLLIGDPEIRPNYEHVTRVLSESQRWWTYDSLNEKPIGLGELTALIRQHQPDEVLIDGVSLLASTRRGSQVWEEMKDTIYGLKNMATIHEIPILVNHQAVNSNRGRRTEISTVGRGDDFIMPSLNDAAFGDAFVQACSDIITMCGEPTSPNINWYSLRKTRERGWQTPLSSRMGMAVDFATGRIHDLSHLGYDPEIVGMEARRLLG